MSINLHLPAGVIAATYDGSPPTNVGSPVKGQFYFNIKNGTYHCYDGTQWRAMSGTAKTREPTIEELAEMYPAVKEAKDQLDFIVAMVRDHDECKESNG